MRRNCGLSQMPLFTLFRCYTAATYSNAHGTFRHVRAGLPNQPLPLAVDMQHREVARAKGGALAVFVLR
jgi:hypothetical protein